MRRAVFTTLLLMTHPVLAVDADLVQFYEEGAQALVDPPLIQTYRAHLNKKDTGISIERTPVDRFLLLDKERHIINYMVNPRLEDPELDLVKVGYQYATRLPKVICRNPDFNAAIKAGWTFSFLQISRSGKPLIDTVIVKLCPEKNIEQRISEITSFHNKTDEGRHGLTMRVIGNTLITETIFAENLENQGDFRQKHLPGLSHSYSIFVCSIPEYRAVLNEGYLFQQNYFSQDGRWLGDVSVSSCPGSNTPTP